MVFVDIPQDDPSIAGNQRGETQLDCWRYNNYACEEDPIANGLAGLPLSYE